MQQERTNSSASSSLSSTSPSFTCHSSKNLSDIAARVVHELNLSHDDNSFIDFYPSLHQSDVIKTNNDIDDDNESEFEFAVLTAEDTSAITADEIFYDGKIKPIYYYPVFDTVSSSTLENDELERVPHDTYCVWSPKKKEQENTVAVLKKKSNSTGLVLGLPKRWRFKDLLHKSHSDGKDSFVFLTPPHQYSNSSNNNRREKVTAVNGGYGYNNGGKKIEGMKKKSYLPYREELIGVFSYVNAFH